MIPHALFVEQLSKMHLDASTDQILLGIIQALRSKTLHDLKQKKLVIKKQLETISSNETLRTFNGQITEELNIIESLIKKLTTDIKSQKNTPPSDQELNQPNSKLWHVFNQQFAQYFPNLQLLIHTLSDAPSEIKTQLVPLITLVLDRITDEKEKTAALKALSNEQLKDLIEQSRKTYDDLTKQAEEPIQKTEPEIKALNNILETLSTEEDKAPLLTQISNLHNAAQKEKAAIEQANGAFKLRCKSITHSCVAELVHRECASHADSATKIKRLMTHIPDIQSSDILDDINETHPEIQAEISQLLPQSIDWKNKTSIPIVQATQKLYQRLKFGQKDLREYVAEAKKRLATDLFWAETIYETRLFPAGDSELRYKIALENKKAVEITNQTKKEIEASKKHPIDAQNQITMSPEDMPKYDKILWAINKSRMEKTKESFNKNLFNIPRIKKEQEERITVEFLASKYQPTTKKAVDTVFSMNNMYGYHDNTIANFMIKNTYNVISEIETVVFDGLSLEDIQTQIEIKKKALAATLRITQNDINNKIHETRGLISPQKTTNTSTNNAFKIKLEALQTELEQSSLEYDKYVKFEKDLIQYRTELKLADLASLQLGSSTELDLRLRKLLELLQFKATTDLKALHFLNKTTIDHLLSGDRTKTQAALKTEGLDEKINQAYKAIAALPDVDPSLQTTWEKAKKIVGSTKRKKRLDASLQTALAPTNPERRKQIIAAYAEEYEQSPEILETLGIQDNRKAIDEMHQDIVAMATEFDRLLTRTEQGIDILDDQENQAYFDLIGQIAQQLPRGTNLKEVGFKLSHKLKTDVPNEITIQIGQESRKMTITPSYPLPYSLIKPQGYDNFELSFGGSRGVVAPFAGLEKAYGKGNRKKGFKNFRLVGEGQQGTVKALQNFITHAGSVLKKVYLTQKDQKQTFKASAREQLETLPISARDDSQFEVEADIVVAQSLIGQDETQHAMSYRIIDKPRATDHNSIFDAANPLQGYLIMKRAPGRSYQQMANDRLKLEQRDKPEYHNPTRGKKEDAIRHDLQDTLNLSSALLNKAIELGSGSDTVKVTHNDIKPENFNAERKPDGSWNVNFTDWGTGGFEEKVTNEQDIPENFKALLSKIKIGQKKEYSDSNGRFLRRTNTNEFVYGVNPQLQILGGKFHCTLPYITPQIKRYTDKTNMSSIPATDETLDNWALTTMLFGVCNKAAYLEFSKGRANQYYAIPGILEEKEGQLTIIDANKFNKYFGVTSVGQNNYNDALMYIPGNAREGEPLHLYRRLSEVAKSLDPQAPEYSQIQLILTSVSISIANGTGLDKKALKTFVTLAQKLLISLDPEAKKAAENMAHSEQAKQERLQALWEDSFATHENLAPKLKDLCTLPTTEDQINRSQAKLESIMNGVKASNYTHLLKECIEAKQESIFLTLLAHLNANHSEALQAQIKEQDLFHYALQEGLHQGAEALYATLSHQEQTYQMSLIQHQAPYIKWQGSALDIAIRRNDETQLTFLLHQIAADTAEHTSIIHKALHTSAVLTHHSLFQRIKEQYKLSDQSILAMNDSNNTPSPYHLLLRSSQALDTLPWAYWINHPEAAKQFLLLPQPYTPCLMATEAGNIAGLYRLLDLGEKAQLTPEDWITLFTLRDANAKNIANYLSENNIRQVLPELIIRIKKIPGLEETQKAAILSQLLFNSAPHNPVANELDNPTKSSEENMAWMAQLQAAILPSDPRDQSKEMCSVYYGLLLNNKRWLIKNREHKALPPLMLSSSIDWVYPFDLIKKLSNAKDISAEEKKYYENLANHIKTQHPEEKFTQEHKNHFEAIETELIRRTAPITEVLQALSNSNIEKLKLENELRDLQHKSRDAEAQLLAAKTQISLTTEAFNKKSNDLKAAQELLKELQLSNDSKSQDYSAISEELRQQKATTETLTIAKKDLKTKLKTLKESEQLLSEQAQELQKELNVTQLALEKNEGILQEKEMVITTLETQVMKLKDDLSTVKDLLHDQHIQYQRQDIIIEENKTALEEAEAERAELAAAGEASIALLSQKDVEIQTLRQRLETLEKERDQIIVINKHLQSKIEELQSNLEKLQHQFDASKIENVELTQSLEQIRQDLTQAKDSAQKTIEELEAQVLTLEQRVETLSVEVASTKENLEAQTTLAATLQTTLETKEAELVQAIRLGATTQEQLQTDINSLHAQLETHLSAISDLQRTLEEAQSKADTLEQTLDASSEENTELKTSLDHIQKELTQAQTDAQQTIEELQDTVKTLEQRVETLSVEVASTKQNLEAQTTLAATLQTTLATKEAELVQAIRLSATTQEQLQTDINSLHAQLETHLSAISDLQQTLEEAQSTATRLEKELSTSKEDNTELKTSLDHIRQELTQAQTDAQQTIEELEAQVLTLEQRVETLSVEVASTKENLEAQTTLATTLQTTLETKEAELVQAIRLGATTQEQLQTDINSLHTQVETHLSAISDLQRTLEEAQSKADTLEQTLDASKEENTELKTSLDHIQKELTQAQTDAQQTIEELQDTVKTLEQRVEALSVEVASTKQNLEAQTTLAATLQTTLATKEAELVQAIRLGATTQEQLQTDINSLHTQLETHLSAISDLQQTLEEAQNTATRLEKELSTSKEDNTELKISLAKTQEELTQAQTDAQQTIEELQDTVKTLEQRVETLSVEVASTKQNLEAQTTLAATLQTTLATKEAELVQAIRLSATTQEQLQTDINSLHTQLETHLSAISDLQRTLEEAQNTATRLEKELSTSKEENTELKISLAKTQEELTQAQTDAQQTIEELQDTVKTLEQRVETLSVEVASTKQNLEAQTTLAATLQTTLATKEAELVQAIRLGATTQEQLQTDINSLRAQLETHLSAISDLQQTLEEAQGKADTLEQALNVSKEENTELKTSLDHIQKELTQAQTDAQKTIEELQDTVKTLEQRVETLSLEVASTKQNLEAQTTLATTLQTQLATKEAELVQAIRLGATTQEQLQTDINSLHAQLETHLSAISDLQQTLEEAQGKADTLEQALNVSKEENTELKTSLDHIRQELTQAQTDAQQTIEELQDTVKTLEQRVETLSVEVASTKENLEAQTTLATTLQTQLEKKEAELVQAIRLGATTQEQLQTDINSLHTQVETHLSAISDLNANLTKAQGKADTLEQALNVSKEENTELKISLDHIQKDLTQAKPDAQKTIEELQDTVKTLEQRVEALSVEVASTKQNLEAQTTLAATLQTTLATKEAELVQAIRLSATTQEQLQTDINSLHTQLETHLSAISDLQRTLEEAQNTATRLEKELSTSKEENTELKTSLDHIQKELTQAQTDAQKTIEELQDTVKTLEQRVETLSVEVASTKQNLEAQTTLATTLQTTLETKEAELVQAIRLGATTQEQLQTDINSLHAQLETHLSAISDLQRTLEEAQGKADTLEQALDASSEENTELKISLDHIQKELTQAQTDAQKTIEELQDTVKTLEQRVETLSLEVASTKQNLEAQTTLAASLQTTLETKEAELVQAIRLGATTQEQLQTDINSLHAQLETHLSAISDLQQTLEEAQSKADTLEQALDASSEDNTELKTSLDHIRQELTQAQTDAQKTIEELQDTVKTLEQRVETLSLEVASTKQNLEAQTTLAASLQTQLATKEAELVQAIRLGATTQEQLQTDINSLHTQVETHLSAISDLQQTLEEAQSKADTLEQALDASSEENTELKTSLDHIRQELTQAQTDAQKTIEELQDTVKTLEQRVETLSLEVASTKQNLEAQTTLAASLQTTLETKEAELVQAIRLGATTQEQLQTDINSLHTQVETHLSAISDLNANLTKAQGKADTLEQALNVSKEENTELKISLDHIQKELTQAQTDAQKTIEELQDTVKTLEQRVEALSVEVASTKQNLEAQTTLATTLQTQLATKEAELAQAIRLGATTQEQLQTDINSLHAQVETHLSAISDLQRTLEEAQNTATRLEKELSTSKEDNTELKISLDHIQKELTQAQTDAQKTIEELQDTVKTLEQRVTDQMLEIEQANATIETLQLEYAELDKELSQSKQRLENNLRAQEDIRKQLFASEEENTTLKNDLEVLQRHYTSMYQSHTDFLAKTEGQKLQITNLEDSIFALHNQNDDLIALITQEIGENSALASQLKASEQEIENMVKDVATLARTLTSRDAMIQQLQQTIQEKDDYILQIEAQCRGLQTQLRDDLSNLDLECARVEQEELLQLYREAQKTIAQLQKEKWNGRKHHTSSLSRSDSRPTARSVHHKYKRTFRTSQLSDHASSESDNEESLFITRHDTASAPLSEIDRGEYSGNTTEEDEQDLSVTKKTVPRSTLFSPKEDYHRAKSHLRHSYDPPKQEQSKPVSPKITQKTASPSSSSNRSSAEPSGPMSVTMYGNRTLQDVEDDIREAVADNATSYTQHIINNKFVRLEKIATDASHSPKRLLDATVDKVTVYRRFTEDPAIPIAERARVVLKSMGIPASDGFELPEELVINGKKHREDFKDNGGELYQVIQEMFDQYDAAIEKEQARKRHGSGPAM